MNMTNSSLYRLPIMLLFLTLAVLIWSGLAPHDRLTWWLEVLPVLIGVPILLASAKSFPLTRLLYLLIFVHAVILIVGGKYTYARVPLGFWMQDWFEFGRNHYDRIGHLAQGFIPAILARELLLRKTPLQPGGWLFYIVISICEGFSAVFELFEWLVSTLSGAAGDAYLATQGDIWDTQWDMWMCLIGAIAAYLLLAKLHNRELSNLAAYAKIGNAEKMRSLGSL